MRYSVVLVVVALASAGLVGTLLVGQSESPSESSPTVDRLVRPGEAGNAVWPYTSRTRSVHDRTLAINVVVHGDEDRVRYALARRTEANWTGLDENETVEESPWGEARGAARYTYITGEAVTGHWIDAEYQLGVGDYLGRRVHIRAYPAPSGNWTAFQAHEEYWDWFRLRHTVTSVSNGARFLERDLRDEPFVEGVSREYHGYTGGGSDGWLTVIRLRSHTLPLVAGLAVLGAAVSGNGLCRLQREHLIEIALPIAVAGVVLAVRAAGLAGEALFPALNPKVFAALLYPILATGPPLVVWLLEPSRRPGQAALLAAGGLGAGVVLDMLGVGVTAIPIRLVVHRVALAATLGVFTLGVGRGDRTPIFVGALAWFALLLGAVLGFL